MTSLLAETSTSSSPSLSETAHTRLPPECVELIARYLWSDLRTLRSLLLCNRSFFSLAAPLLYRDPFNLIQGHHTWTDASKAERTAHLIRLLYLCSLTKQGLGQTQQQQDQDALLSTTTTISSSSYPPSSYYSTGIDANNVNANANGDATTSLAEGILNLRYLPLPQEDPCLTVNPAFETKIPLPLTTDYLFHFTLQGQIPRTFRAFQLMYPSCSSKNRLTLESACARVSQQLILAFARHFPSRIQVLSMTPSQLGQLLREEEIVPGKDAEEDKVIVKKRGIVDDLRMLRRLELDYGASKSPLRQTPHTFSIPDLRIGREKSNKRVLDEVDIPLEFIRQHRSLFLDNDAATTLGKPKQEEDLNPLKQILIRGAHTSWTPTQLLTQIHALEVIDLSAWNSDVPHLDHIPSTRLKCLRTNIGRRLNVVEVDISYLQRSPRLEEVWMPSQSPETFRWAIDLDQSIGDFASEVRKRRRGLGRSAPIATTTEAVETAASTETTVAESTSSTSNEAIVVPAMKKIKLYGSGMDLVPSLEDAADAFRDSLEELTGNEDESDLQDDYVRLTIDWFCPRLTVLDLRGRFVRYMDLQSSLRHCPELRVIRLQIEARTPRSSSSRFLQSDVDQHQHQSNEADLPVSLVTGSMTEQDSTTEEDDEETIVDLPPTPLEAARRRFSIFTTLKRLEELSLRGPHWNIDNDVLNVLAEPVPVLATQDFGQAMEGAPAGQEVERISYLQENLRLFLIPNAHLPNRAGLVPFVQRMRKLEVLQMGTMYGYAIEDLRKAAGPRLAVDCTGM
ncbi:hypothetical protein BGZ83_009531 [Gryganskiella cystojenkinii]|nr:hypothetical protein BGZ83_009531 [Gryganskiella cystojenkinii]